MVQASPALRARIAQASDATAAELAQTHPAFAAAFAEYQAQWGCRAIRLEVIDPNMDETPAVTLRLLSGMVERSSMARAPSRVAT